MVQLPAPALVCNLVAAGLLASAGACDRLRLCGLVQQCVVAPCFALLSPAAKPGGGLATSAPARSNDSEEIVALCTQPTRNSEVRSVLAVP